MDIWEYTLNLWGCKTFLFMGIQKNHLKIIRWNTILEDKK